MGVTAAQQTLPLTWKTDTPVGVGHWPLPSDKLCALKQLVKEQLKEGHIVPSASPWNSPVFVIQKKSGKWSLLHDLRQINDILEDMGVLQPGLPSPTMILKQWPIVIIELKDCFFTILLDP